MKDKMTTKKQYTDAKICWMMYGLTLLMMVVLSLPLSVSYILDETGTVANAAYLAGYNWNNWVTHTGGFFYKYGQAVFYYPVLQFVENPYLLYKLLLIVNGIFTSLTPVLTYLTLRRHLKQEDKGRCVLVSLCIAVIPGPVLYSLFARAEAMLVALAWLILYTLLEAMDADTTSKKIILSALLAFLSVYAYMCHSRGIVFVIATCMVVAVVRFLLKNRNVCLSSFLVSLCTFMFLDDRLTQFFKDHIWGEGGARKNTVEGVSLSKWENLPTAEGIETIVKNTTGWLFNTFSSTLGLAILGIVFAFLAVILYFSKKNIEKKEFVINLYAFLIFMGTLAIGVLFFFGSSYRFVTGEAVKRGDRFVYTRYMATTYTVVVFVALFYLFFKKDVFGIKTKVATLLGSGLLIVYCRTWLKDFVNHIRYSWRNTIDCGLFFDTVSFGNDAGKYSNVSRGLLMMAVFAFVILVIVLLATHYDKRFRYQNAVLVFLGLCCLAMLSVNYVKLRLATDFRPMLRMGSAISQMYDMEQDTKISEEYNGVYIDKSIKRYKVLQMALPRFDVHVTRSMSAQKVDNMFIICASHYVNEAWMGDDCYLFKNWDREKNRTTVVVKGDALKAELEERGFELEPISEEYLEQTTSTKSMGVIGGAKTVLEYQWQCFDESR